LAKNSVRKASGSGRNLTFFAFLAEFLPELCGQELLIAKVAKENARNREPHHRTGITNCFSVVAHFRHTG
jgi:hypothetical protein